MFFQVPQYFRENFPKFCLFKDNFTEKQTGWRGRNSLELYRSSCKFKSEYLYFWIFPKLLILNTLKTCLQKASNYLAFQPCLFAAELSELSHPSQNLQIPGFRTVRGGEHLATEAFQLVSLRGSVQWFPVCFWKFAGKFFFNRLSELWNILGSHAC